jgi:glycosyltransferase involved in cell wall biosynthesis
MPAVSQLKVQLLVSWKEEGKWDFYRGLGRCVAHLVAVQPVFWDAGGSSLLNRLSMRLAEFYVPLLALRSQKDFDAVVSWSMRSGVCFAIFKRILGKSSTTKHIIQDFHIDLIRKDLFYKLRLRFLRWALPGIDYFLCTSTRETELYTELFGIPAERIRFFPMAFPKELLARQPLASEGYIFSYGNSDRDYDSLIEVVENTEVKLVILSQSYTPRRRLPPNITLLTGKVSWAELTRWIQAASFIVLPLSAYDVSAGQTAMLESMALGRPVIITANMATMEYANEGETALFVPAGDPDQLRAKIRLLWTDSERREEMGRRARETLRCFPERQLACFLEVLHHLFEGPPIAPTSPESEV